MKKWILSAALLLFLGGTASAQKQTSKDTKTTQQKKVKQAPQNKSKETGEKVIKKDSASHQAKIKLVLPPADTTGMIPKQKDQ